MQIRNKIFPAFIFDTFLRPFARAVIAIDLVDSLKNPPRDVRKRYTVMCMWNNSLSVAVPGEGKGIPPPPKKKQNKTKQNKTKQNKKQTKNKKPLRSPLRLPLTF